MLKQTPLCDLHLKLGAKMVPFAGYQMPVHYGQGIIHEHLHCRSHAGFFDISHMGQCLILGDNAASELEQLTPSDITGLNMGAQKYTVLTNNEGGIIDDIIITRVEAGLMIIVNAACKDKDFSWLKNRLFGRCTFKDLPDQALLALQGPAAASVMAKFSKEAAGLLFMQSCAATINGLACSISRSGYTGEDGFEISVANQDAEQLAGWLLAEEDVEAVGLGARDTLRLEAGLCLYGHELNEAITPVEAGLQWLFKKGHKHFPGADKILQQLQHGPEKIRTGLLVESKIPVREGSVVVNNDDQALGIVTSGSFSPSLGKPVAMALLERNAATLGNTLYALVRERKIPVTVTKLPFIPHRYLR
ncbi:glycine cleavage system aminomethyltransferase GcvT [Methylobacter sp. S3L5C]|uniref:glycine cleavage system aminomethyltransferase GcvT n=1 Tax=Methylobacter sp. S3L5C TaxID=2839024 RepID=UPI001FAD258B|nr:glycine cleavage system aminomethyltransferase GcvT [Methylobacter sp. S3L5C]UOA08853.1 glycine cleavage system aminomethyltransferase GcvT [Methylobacter sp. S3L5C]